MSAVKELNTGEGKNRFKFQSFRSRLENLSFDVVHQLERRTIDIESSGSYFREELNKWVENNSTTNFTEFSTEALKYSNSLAQILYSKAKLSKLIVKHLDTDSVSSLEPILNLIPHIARDLQDEFYPHFFEIYPRIASLLNHQNSQVIEWCFNAIAYSFKYLGKLICKDLSAAFKLISALFGAPDNKVYLRQFAAESFGFLVRRAKGPELKAIVRKVAFHYVNNPTHDVLHGLDALLLESMKNVGGRLHSQSQSIMQEVFDVLLNFKYSLVHENLGIIFSSMLIQAYAPGLEKSCSMFTLCQTILDSSCEFARKENIEPIWNSILFLLTKLPKLDSTNGLSSEFYKSATLILGIVNSYVGYKRGFCVIEYGPIYDFAESVSSLILSPGKVAQVPLLTLRELVTLITLLLTQSHSSEVFSKGTKLVELVFHSKSSRIISDFCHILIEQNFIHFAPIVMPLLIKTISEEWDSNSSWLSMILVKAFSGNLIRLSSSTLTFLSSDKLVQFSSNEPVNCMLTSLKDVEWKRAFEECDSLEGCKASKCPTLASFSSILVILENVDSPTDDTLETLQEFLFSLLEYTFKKENHTDFFTLSNNRSVIGEALIGQAIGTITAVSKIIKSDSDRPKKLTLSNRAKKLGVISLKGHTYSSFLLQIWKAQIQSGKLQKFFSSKPVLKGVSALAHNLKPHKEDTAVKEIFSLAELKKMYTNLKVSISSHDSQLRIYCLEILSCFDCSNSETPEEDSLFKTCLLIDSVPNDLESYRTKLIHLRKLGVMMNNGQIPHFDDVISRLCLGIFSTNFRPLWPDALKTIKLHSRKNSNAVSSIFLSTLESLLDGSFISSYEKTTATINYLSGFQYQSLDTPSVSQSVEAVFSNKHPHQLVLARSVSQLLEVVDSPKSRCDYWNIAEWCLQVFIDSPHLAEAQSETVSRLFFNLFQRFIHLFPEHQSCSSLIKGNIEDDSRMEDSSEHVEHETDDDFKPLSSQPVYKQMLRFLELLRKFQRPESVKSRAKFEAVFEELLTSSEIPIQTAALKCIESYRYQYLNEYSSHLHGFLSEIGFRDELATFDVAPGSETIDKAHRTQLLPYVIKLLFGRLKAKKKHKDNHGIQHSKHKAVLTYLSKLTSSELGQFVELYLRPFNNTITESLSLVHSGSSLEMGHTMDASKLSPKMVSGFLSLLHDVLKQFGYLIESYFPSLMTVVLHLLHSFTSMQNLSVIPTIQKEVRQLCMKRLADFFAISSRFNYEPYMSCIFSVAVSPRLHNFALENSQAPSALLEMFLTWSKHDSLVYNLVKYDTNVLPSLYLCLASPLSKVSVITLVIELIENIFKLDQAAKESASMSDTPSLMSQILLPNVSQLLDSLECVMTQPTLEPGPIRDGLFKRQITILSKLASFVMSDDQARKLLSLLSSSLHKPSKLLDDFTKCDILVIVSELVKLIPELQSITPLFKKYYQSFSRLFFSISYRPSRQALMSIFTSFAAIDPELAVISNILADLNAFSQRRLDEPDYEKRLAAFTHIHDGLASQLSSHQWLPLLYNFFYFLTDEDEMSLRNSGSFAIIKFMSCASQEGASQTSMMDLMGHVVLPTIKRGLKFRSETIRSEFVLLLGKATHHFSTHLPYSELVPLLGTSNKSDQEERDDEIEQTNFFVGIYHIQRARRVKVIARFSAYLNQSQPGKKGASNSPIRPSLLQSVFLPILSDLLFSCNDNDISYEAIRAIAAIARHFPWTLYYGLIRRYLSALHKKNDKEPVFLKLLLAVLDGFHFEMGTAKDINSEENDDCKQHLQVEDDIDDEDIIQHDSPGSNIDQIHSVVVKNLIPDLVRLLEKCSESKIPDRIPIALSITKILKRLPQFSFKKNLPSLLMNVCNLLRSRDSGHRDTIRSNLVRIAQLLGPPHLFFIVKELQSTLTRGYMRHILSFTVNALLVSMVPTIHVGQIDHTAPRIMEIVIEDMFGEASKEKDAQEYSGKQKEAKTRKSPATLELLASIINFQSLGILLSPLKQILHETDTQATLKRVDEALQRISNGLVKNAKFDGRVLLTFCHGLVQQNIADCQPLPSSQTKGKRPSQQEITFTVHTKRVRLDGTTNYFATNAHKFVEFGLTLFLTSLRKDKFDLEKSEAISFLNPFVDVMGEALYSNYQPIVILALKNICALLKYPLPSFETALPVMVKRVLAVIHQLNATNSDLVQSAFKLLTMVIKDSRLATISNTELEFLVALIRPDLEEPSRQGTTFALIRAILSRQLLVSALYDLIDDVSTIMITGQTETVRAMCRQVYLQFLLDYPQGAPRVEKQMKLLIANTSYQFESGRESAMEAINILITKLAPEVLISYVEMFFLGLVVVLINDDSNKCREMAGALIKSLFSRMNDKTLESISNLIFRWCSLSTPYSDGPGNNYTLKRTGLQALGLMIDALGSRFLPYCDKAMKRIIDSVNDGRSFLIQAEEKQILLQEQNPDIETSLFDFPTHWEIPYYAFHTFTKLLSHFPSYLVSASSLELWSSTIKLLLHPHTWIRLSVLRLLGTFFATFEPETLKTKENSKPYGFMNIANLKSLARQHCILQKSPLLDDDLGQQWVKNMFFIGRVFYHHSLNTKQEGSTGITKVRSIKSSGSSDDESDDENECALVDENPLGWLFKRCSYLARFEVVKTGVSVRKTFIFQLFAALSSIIEPKDLAPLLIPILYPLHRTLKDPVIQVDTSRFPGLIELATEVDEFVKQRVGPTPYLEAITSIQETMRERRNRRKDHVAQRALANPEAYAAARTARNVTKKAAKKRRASELAQIPGSHLKRKKDKPSVASKLSGF